MHVAVIESGSSSLNDETGDGLLWHYTTPAGLIGIITNREFWLSDSAFLNDSMEMHEAFLVIEGWLEREGSNKDGTPLAISEILESFRKLSKWVTESSHGRVFVGSFSENGDLLAQWRAYCALGGYAIGFDKEALLAVASEGMQLCKCRYRRPEQEQLLNESLDNISALLKATRLAGSNAPSAGPARSIARDHSLRQKLLRISPQIKNENFLQEQEWRLIALDGQPPLEGHAELRLSSSLPGILIPYRKLTWTEINSPLRAIRIGPMSHQDLAIVGIQHLLRKLSLSSQIDILTSDVPLRA